MARKIMLSSCTPAIGNESQKGEGDGLRLGVVFARLKRGTNKASQAVIGKKEKCGPKATKV